MKTLCTISLFNLTFATMEDSRQLFDTNWYHLFSPCIHITDKYNICLLSLSSWLASRSNISVFSFWTGHSIFLEFHWRAVENLPQCFLQWTICYYNTPLNMNLLLGYILQYFVYCCLGKKLIMGWGVEFPLSSARTFL